MASALVGYAISEGDFGRLSVEIMLRFQVAQFVLRRFHFASVWSPMMTLYCSSAVQSS